VLRTVNAVNYIELNGTSGGICTEKILYG